MSGAEAAGIWNRGGYSRTEIRRGGKIEQLSHSRPTPELLTRPHQREGEENVINGQVSEYLVCL